MKNYRTWRHHPVMRRLAVAAIVCTTTQFIGLGAYAALPPPPKPFSELKPGLTQTPDSALQRKIDANDAAAHRAPDVQTLSTKEMRQLWGRGVYRNKYFSGALPWQRSLRDVNLSTGNLFKSFTDIQVSPARGAGLALQRTYNSDDERIGPFGVGWTHAYDIRMEEEGGGTDLSDRTGFFGGKHKYHRDADGLLAL